VRTGSAGVLTGVGLLAGVDVLTGRLLAGGVLTGVTPKAASAAASAALASDDLGLAGAASLYRIIPQPPAQPPSAARGERGSVPLT